MAIENSMLGAAHACANPLTAAYIIAHGVAVGLMLPPVIRFNSTIVGGDYGELLETAKIPVPAAMDAGKRLSERISELKTTAAMPHRLRECGVDKSALPELAKAAATQWTGKFNPRPATETELLELYETAF
jgi:alcohol dehydrogenase